MPGNSNEPLAMTGVIAPIATAIRAGGQQGEPIRPTLDIYEEEEVVRRLMELRGKEFKIVLVEV
jgi:hypothetical protein